MKRNSGVASKLARSMEWIERTSVKLKGGAPNSVSEQSENRNAAGELEGHLNGLGRQAAWRRDSDAGDEAFGSHAKFTPEELRIFSQSGMPLANGNGLAAAPAKEEGPTTADGTRPEVEGMLRTLLEAGGEQIVERLKELDAETAAAECTRPELGRLIESYYVPLLLSALELSDEEFDAEYPGERQATAAQRAGLAEVLEDHWLECPRCLLKASSDWEWDAHVNKIAHKNSDENNSRLRRDMRTSSG